MLASDRATRGCLGGERAQEYFSTTRSSMPRCACAYPRRRFASVDQAAEGADSRQDASRWTQAHLQVSEHTVILQPVGDKMGMNVWWTKKPPLRSCGGKPLPCTEVPAGDYRARRGPRPLAETPAYLIEARPAWTCPDVSDRCVRLLPLFGLREEIAVEYQTRSGSYHVARHASRTAASHALRPARARSRLITLSIASVATGLLVIPGAWLYTRWSLSIPAIRSEDLGPVAALKRSNELARGRFWFVFGTATLAFFLEEALIHAGALVGYLVSGSHTWGEWVGGSIIASLVIPLAALTTSVAYSSVARPAESTEGA